MQRNNARFRPVMQLFTCLLVAMALSLGIFPETAAASSGNKHTWLRAKITYEFDDGIEGLSDSMLVFSSRKWQKKDDGWYYYDDYVSRGDKIRFIDAVDIPEEWTNDIINKKFRIIVTVQASEAIVNEEGFNDNRAIHYSDSFELWNSGFKNDESYKIAKSSKSLVKIHEYQLDDNGKEIAYQNDKLVIPGQRVSKIVEFEIDKESFIEDVATGDISILQILTCILLGAAAGIIVFYIKKQRKEEKRDAKKENAF